MTLSDLAAIGSFISGLAVLTSLIFLYFQLRQVNQQVRQAERNQQAAIAQARTESQVSVVLAMLEPANCDVYMRGMAAAEDLLPVELMRFRLVIAAMMSNFENAVLQHKAGALTDAAFDSPRRIVGSLMAGKGFRGVWRTQRHNYGTEFRDFMDGLLRDTPVSAPADPMQLFRDAVAADMPLP